MALSDNVNTKSAAWDTMRGTFDACGGESFHPTDEEIKLFLESISPQDNIAVIGAITKKLIDALIAKNINPVVLDFSPDMCQDLKELSGLQTIYLYDVTQDPPEHLIEQFDFILTHRLLNQFTRKEAIHALYNMAQLLNSQGRIRTSVKLGFYASDAVLIEQGKQKNIVQNFYDPCTKTIDFSAARELLDQLVQVPSDIPEDTLIKWYQLRGEITRFEHQDMIDIASTCRDIMLESVIRPEKANVENTHFYTFTKVI